MRHAGLSLQAACDRVVSGIEEIGLIAVDAQGNFTMPFDTTLMHRAWMVDDGPLETRVF
jgi:beta-aspartyl-peptidase (threonine type)